MALIGFTYVLYMFICCKRTAFGLSKKIESDFDAFDFVLDIFQQDIESRI